MDVSELFIDFFYNSKKKTPKFSGKLAQWFSNEKIERS